MHDKVTWEHSNPLFAMPIPADQNPVDGHPIIYPDTTPDGAFQIRLPSGLDILITRIFIDENGPDDRTQLCVSINTEMMETDHRDGEPLMEVLLNDAVLYDEEP